MERIVVVGASLAGAHAALTLRRQGFEGELLVIGGEPHRPYDRPPLSKQYLLGGMGDDRLALRAVDEPEPLAAQWLLGHRAVAFEPAASGGTVVLDDGTRISADGVVIATGATPRRLPDQPDVADVVALRTLEDATALRRALAAGPGRLVVIGFGFIGAEVAATARQLGWEVTIVEAAAHPLARVLGAASGAVVAGLHRDNGVEVRLGAGVSAIEVADGRVEGVTLDDGGTLPCSVAVVGIGAVPETGWLTDSGLPLSDGVVAAASLLVAPGIVAAGDVVRWPNPRFGGVAVRVEQWENAVESGVHAARSLLADAAGTTPEPFAPVPWFWSDQYDRKIQLAGVASGRTEVVHGSHADRRFVELHLDERGEVTGVLCWNRPRHAIQARRLLAELAGPGRFREELV